MCRIAGIFDPRAADLAGDIVRMRDAMRRGGPDGEGVFIHPELPLALGHRRLALLDLSAAGSQPMRTADGRLQITYNGEIYNFKELRKELEAMGHRFVTQTDTEVILYSFIQWGKSCFGRFNGMFALAIWDEAGKELILARDHAGMKPLYYHLDDSSLYFASEIRAFKALGKWEAEPMWRPLFLMFGNLPEPFTTLKGVQMLDKGEWMSVQLPSMQVQRKCFYKDDFTTRITNKEEALDATRELLIASVRRHLIADAPVGLFLSGGIDSSLLTILAAPVLRDKLTTLSIRFEEAAFSEKEYQDMVIDMTVAKHSAFTVAKSDFEEYLPDILEAMDQPSIDAINTYFVSMYAKQCGLKAVLSGLGSDELFGGYPSFARYKNWRRLRYIPGFIKESLGKRDHPTLNKLSFSRFHPMLSLYLMNRGLFSAEKAAAFSDVSVKDLQDALVRLRLPGISDYSTANANAAMEQNLYMKHQLLKDSDAMGMWHGIEIRVPFLDKKLVQAVNSISPAIKFNNDLPKRLLIEAFAAYLPAEIWNRKKQGFTFPFENWLHNSTLMPLNDSEVRIFNRFTSGELHWSRYWVLKLSGMEEELINR